MDWRLVEVNSQLISISLKFSNAIPPSVFSRFNRLRKNLLKSSLNIDFKVYTGLTLLTSSISFTAAFVFSLLLLPKLLLLSTFMMFVLSAVIAILAAITSAGFCYSYPLMIKSSRSKNIDVNLSLMANFMSVLASAGMPPESIFMILLLVGKDFNVDKEVGRIIRDIKIMGLDLHEALKNASESSPSSRLAIMLDGIITTIRVGGDLSGYLHDQAEKFKRERMQNLRRFVDNLSVVAEAYVAFLVAAPLMLIVMLSIMSFLGGTISIGALDPLTILNILTFVIMPMGMALMILAVDTLSPKR
ncbi:MAG: archaeal flagellar protein FlaJ [Thermoproteota archaeon]|nr:archaeal flagellar protein FlaJ [Thermoproteota archaeon]